MTLLLLDTTVLVNAERRGSRLDHLIEDDDEVAIAAVTAAELLVGVMVAAPRYRSKRAAFVEAALESIPILSYDLVVARVHADLLSSTRVAGRPRGAHDLIIAATGRAHERTIVTGDTSGFDALPGVIVRTASH